MCVCVFGFFLERFEFVRLSLHVQVISWCLLLCFQNPLRLLDLRNSAVLEVCLCVNADLCRVLCRGLWLRSLPAVTVHYPCDYYQWNVHRSQKLQGASLPSDFVLCTIAGAACGNKVNTGTKHFLATLPPVGEKKFVQVYSCLWNSFWRKLVGSADRARE